MSDVTLTTNGVRTIVPTFVVDMSGYATIESLAALQSTITPIFPLQISNYSELSIDLGSYQQQLIVSAPLVLNGNTLSISLSPYVLATTLTSTLANYVKTTSLAPYALSSSLSAYALTSSLGLCAIASSKCIRSDILARRVRPQILPHDFPLKLRSLLLPHKLRPSFHRDKPFAVDRIGAFHQHEYLPTFVWS